MPADALVLALGSAFVHALWNILLARPRDPEAGAAVVFLAGGLAFAPVAALTWDVEAAVWPWALASALLETLYIGLLAAAYRRADVSLIYPIARGTAPVLVLLVGIVALARESSPSQIAGVLLVGAGILLVRGLRRPADWTGVMLGLAVASCIAAYTLVDKEGVRYASATAYVELVTFPPALVYAAYVVGRKGRASVRAEIRPVAVIAGIGVFTAYTLVLAALQRASAAAVAAVRETSVVIATVFAAGVLKESVGWGRFAGAALVAGGVALISL